MSDDCVRKNATKKTFLTPEEIFLAPEMHDVNVRFQLKYLTITSRLDKFDSAGDFAIYKDDLIVHSAVDAIPEGLYKSRLGTTLRINIGKGRTIEDPPGHGLIVILQKICTKRGFDRLFGQLIADSREDYFAALNEGDEADARKIKVRLWRDLVVTAASQLWTTPMAWLVHLVGSIWKGN